MAVDIRLPLESKAAPFDPYAGQKGMVDLQNAVNYGRSLDLQAQQREQEVEDGRLTQLEDAAIQAEFAAHTKGEGEDADTDVHAAMKKLRSVVRPKRWTELMTAITEEEGKSITRKINDYKLMDEATKTARETFEGIQDLPENEQQTAYSVWKQSIAGLKIPGLQFLPEELTPEAKRFVNGWGLDVEGRKKNMKAHLDKEAVKAFNADPLFSPEQIERAFTDPVLRRKIQASIMGSSTYRELSGAEKVMKILDDRDKEALEKYKADAAGARATLGPGAGKPPNQGQMEAAGFARRMEQAEKVFEQLEAAGYSRAATSERAFDNMPGEGVPTNRLSQNQAERNFVRAVLRKQSGAVIGADEFEEEAKQYFPRPGDSPHILAQKKSNRQQVFEGFKSEAASAFDMVKPIPPPSMAKVTPKGKIVIRNGRKFEKLNSDTDFSQKNWREVR
jgi:hypothetical protein